MAGKKKTVEPKFLIKEETNVFHHCFKLLEQKMKKNLSWKQGEVIIDEIPHVHYFHNINSLGMDQKTSNFVGGHFHEVSWKVDDDGYPVATCGPALKKVTRKLPNGLGKTEIKSIKWKDLNTDTEIVDNHTHEIEYKHSNRLSMGKAQNCRQPPAQKEVEDSKQVLKDKGEVSINGI